MAVFRWRPGVPARDELRRIACTEIDLGLEELGDDDRHRAVHQVRKRGKKARALLRLVRTAAPALYRRENAAFRDMMRRISEHRDVGVALDTADGLLARFGDGVAGELTPLRDALAQRRDGVLGEDLEARLTAVRVDLEVARQRVAGWELEGEGFEVLAGGLAKTYRRAQARMHDAYTQPSTEAFHLWRKRAKYHRHHLELLEDAWSPILDAHAEELHDLTERLGEEHDLAVLRGDLLAEPARFGGADTVALACGLIDRRRAELQAEARVLGARCFVEEPTSLIARLGGYWETAASSIAPGPLPDPVIPAGR